MSKTTEIKAQLIPEYVTRLFIATGEPVRVHLVAKVYNTSSTLVRKALDAQLNFFDYLEVDLWVGTTFSGKYVRSWAVEPSKQGLRDMLKRLNR